MPQSPLHVEPEVLYLRPCADSRLLCAICEERSFRSLLERLFGICRDCFYDYSRAPIPIVELEDALPPPLMDLLSESTDRVTGFQITVCVAGMAWVFIVGLIFLIERLR